MRRTAAVLLFCSLLFFARTARAVVTTDLNSTTPQQLAQTLAGSGITVTNVRFTGAKVAGGTFTGGVADGLGIESGVILSSGDVANAVGPNTNDGISTANGTPGDADLDAIVGAGHTTFDAAVLEFDFVPTQGTVSFQYVFASDEYNEFVGQFNDVFAFFVDGQNVALVPGTSTPVAINTVNLTANSFFYRNNDPSDLGIPTPFGTQFDGFTAVLTATATLTPNVSHHIKLVIADTDDDILDSAVFLRASSFTTCTVPGQPPSAQIAVAGNPGAPVTGIDFLDLSWAAQAPPPAFYFWALNGVAAQTTATSVPNQPPTGSNDPIVLQVRAACSETVFSPATEVTVSPSPPQASFSASSPVGVGTDVLFTDTSTPAATSVLWIFGDGAISDQQSVTHRYDAAGRYTAWLFASNGAGFDSRSQEIDVVPAAPVRMSLEHSRRAFESNGSGRQSLAGVQIRPGGEHWLHVRSLEASESAIAFLRFRDADGRLVAQRSLYVAPGQDAVYDLTAYGHTGVYTLEIVSMQAVAASVVGREERARVTRRVER
jgi:PKD repeat protein